MTAAADQQLEAYAVALADGIELALPGWVSGTVERVMRAWAGKVPSAVEAATAAAGEAARREVGAAVRALLALDVDEQRTNPLALLRAAVRYPTAVLRQAGVPPVVRSQFDQRAFPDDDYALTPASFADLDASLHEPGLRWGAAKAHVVLRRRGRQP